MCAWITNSSEDNGEGLDFAGYSNVEAAVQTYANVHEETVDSGLIDDDGDNGDNGDNEPTRTSALATVVDAVNTFRSYVECSGGDCEMLSVEQA